MTPVQRWIYAVKPGSWPKLLVPAALGQALGVQTAGRFDALGFAAGVGYTFALLTFIVLMNDWGDQAVDRIKRKMFPEGCSPKTIPDGILTSRSVLVVGIAAGSVSVVFAVWGGWSLANMNIVWLGVAGSLIFVAYTLPPLRLNYRGGGELLEGLGVGVVLPAFHLETQGGQYVGLVQMTLAGFACLSLASAVASGLSDEESDRAGGKHTVVSVFGNSVGRRVVQGALLLGVLIWLLGSGAEEAIYLELFVGAMVALAFSVGAQSASHLAVTNAFSAQRSYKARVHGAIWFGALALSAVILCQVAFAL